MEKHFYIAKYQRTQDGDIMVFKSEKFTWNESTGMTYKQFVNYCQHIVVQKVGILSTQVLSVISA